MQHFLAANWWQEHPEAQILALGGGGATVAMLIHLIIQATSWPPVVTVLEKRLDNLEHCQNVIRELKTGKMKVSFVHSGDANKCDELVNALPPGSMVINATGMGKDIPGSPITVKALFPMGGVVWELNYRGARPFLHQARSQAANRNLTVADGWHYFLYGWSSVMGLVYDVPITPSRFEAFAAASQ